MNTISKFITLFRDLINDRDIFIEHSKKEELLSLLSQIEDTTTYNAIDTFSPESMEQAIKDSLTTNIKYDTDKGITGIQETASILKNSLLKAVRHLQDESSTPKDEKEILMFENFTNWNDLNQM